MNLDECGCRYLVLVPEMNPKRKILGKTWDSMDRQTQGLIYEGGKHLINVCTACLALHLMNIIQG